MDAIRRYVITLTAAAMLCALVKAITAGRKGQDGSSNYLGDCSGVTHHCKSYMLDTYEKVKKLAVTDGFLRRASGYQFYNTSKYTFDRLLADPENIESNFRDYLNGFSANVQDVLAKFDFENIIKRMVDSNTLYLVIKEFGSQKGYLSQNRERF